MRLENVHARMERELQIKQVMMLVDYEQARRVHVWKTKDLHSNMERRQNQKRAVQILELLFLFCSVIFL